MKKFKLAICSLVLMLCISHLQAADLKGTWALSGTAGMGFSLSPSEASDYWPTSFVVSGDLTYMLTDNFGIVPGSFSYIGFSFDKDKFASDMGVASSVMGFIDTKVWTFGYTPGVYFTTSGTSKVRGFGQVGLGIYHNKASVVVNLAQFDMSMATNDFGALFGGGIEVDISEHAAIVGKGRLHFIATEGESTTVLDFSGGIKFYF